MRNLKLIVIFLLSTNACAKSNWELVSISSGNDFHYIDKNSHQKSGDSITYWTRTNYGVRDEHGDLSSKSQSTVNCRTRKHIRRFLITYDDINNSGKITYNELVKGSWTPIAPDSISWSLMKFICK